MRKTAGLLAILMVSVAGCIELDQSPPSTSVPNVVPEEQKEPFDWAFWNQSNGTFWVECALWDADDERYVNDSFRLQPAIITLHLVPDAYGPRSTYGTCALGVEKLGNLAQNQSDRFWDCTKNSTFCWRENYWPKDGNTTFLREAIRLWLIPADGKMREDRFSDQWAQADWTYA